MNLATSTSLFALLAAVVLLPAPVAAQSVGTAGAVNPDAQGTPPGGATKTLNVGGNVVHREKITTTAKGSVQLVFVDRTTLNVGPNSQLVIDEFVYDPSSNTGRMAATLTKGVMRFVGGQTSHTGGATIKTPATTLGVRGGVATISHDAGAGTRVVNHFGQISVRSAQGTEIIRRPGFALNVATPNAAPTAPARVTRTEVDTNNAQLTSKGSQTGGRRETPTDQGASKAVGQANAPVTPTLVQGQPQTTAQAAQVTTQPNTMQQEVPLQQVTQVAATGSQQTVTTTLPEIAPVVTPPVVLPPKRWYTLQGPAGSNGLPPFINSNQVAAGTTFSGKTVGYGVGGANADGTPNTTSRLMSAGVSINGVGAAQTSAIYVVTADIFPETATSVPGGGFVATARRSANATITSANRANGAITPIVNGLSLDANYTPTSIAFNSNDTVANVRSTAPTEQGYYYLGNGTAGSNYEYSGSVTQVANDPNLGTNRPTTGIGGFMSGLMRTFAHGTSSGPSFIVNGDLSVNLGESSRFGAEGRIFRNPNGNTTPLANRDDFGTATLKMGHQGTGTYSRSAYVDYDNFAAREAEISGGGTLSTAIKRTGGAATVNNDRTLLVTSGSVGYAQAFPGVAFCQCEFTRWGFWSLDLSRTGTTSTGAVDGSVQDLVHMGTWVAGNKPTSVEVPTTGSATYTGHVIGSFKSGTNEYLAAGNLSHTINFGTSTGTATVSNLDGKNYSLSSALLGNSGSPGDRNYIFASGNATSSTAPTAVIAPSTSMHMIGHFMKGTTSPVAEMGGQFNVSGLNYIGTGTFAARK